MNLIVVESPTKARTLSRFLGKEYLLEATMGHIKDLPKSKTGVDVDNDFAPDYEVVANKKKYIREIKKTAKKAKKIFLATDPDREGEAIASHVKDLVGNSRISRIVFHEITKGAVERAIENPREIDQNLVDAQIARRVLDRLVGYKLSPLLWKKVRRGLSAGRVQTVTVRLIVEKEREIEAFVKKEFWEIFCEVSREVRVSRVPRGEKLKARDTFTVKLIKIGEKKAEVKDGKTAKKVVSDLKKAGYKVSDVKKREVKKNPYPPFTTSTLTQSAARMFFWSAKRTMSIAQRLYEQGLITYHRTDSTSIAKTALANVRAFIKKEYGSRYLPTKPRIYKTKAKVAQEAHEAIRPTNVNTRYQIRDTRYGRDAEKLYNLIWKRFVACQMAAGVYDETTIEVIAELKSEHQSQVTSHYLLRASGQILKFDGWRAVYGELKNQKSKIPPGQKPSMAGGKTPNGGEGLPDVKKGDLLQLIKVLSQQKFTEPPPRYGEASLVKMLEKLGIGRPSTYAPTISTIQIRNYVEKKEGRFHPTPIGVAVNDFLIKNFPNVFEYSFTAGMEGDLDKVANGKKEWVGVIRSFWSPFEGKLESVEEKSKRVKIETEKLGKKCPKCVKEGLSASRQGELVIRIGRFGKFISCSRFPECDYTGRYLEKIGIKCLDCKKGDVIVKKTKRGKRFYGCSRYPKCKWASWRKPKVSKKDYANRT